MPLAIRAYCFLIVLLFCGGLFYFWHFRDKTSARWVGLWLLVTTAACFSGTIPVYALVVAVICFFSLGMKPMEKIAGYFLLLPAFPSAAGYEIPGLIPGIRFWFVLNHPRILSLAILVPLFFNILTIPGYPKKEIGALKLDGPVFIYLVLQAFLAFRAPTMTSAFRHCLMLFLDIFLPYYVVSRTVWTKEDIKKIILAIVFSAFILSIIGIFEEAKKWLIYETLGALLASAPDTIRNILFRQGVLRILATLGHPIAFGFFLVVGIGGAVYLAEDFKKNIFFWGTCLAFLFSALILTISRGPWLGMITFFLIWFLFLKNSKRARFLIAAGGILLLSAPFFLATPIGQKAFRTLPFVGVSDQDTIEFRDDLLDAGIIATKKKPWLGSTDFLETEELKSLERGGLIDITNTYLGVTLTSGVVGLFFFLFVFVASLKNILSGMRWVGHQKMEEMVKIGRLLFSVMVAMLVVLGTVSSISYIPYYYWLWIALSAAYLKIIRKEILQTRVHQE